MKILLGQVINLLARHRGKLGQSHVKSGSDVTAYLDFINLRIKAQWNDK